MELIPVEKFDIAKVFKDGPETLLDEIERRALDFEPDLSTATSRKAIAGQAYKVAQSKAFLDKKGKELVSGLKEKAKKIDVERKKIRDRLDELKDRVRKPLTDWEAAEEARIAAEALEAEISFAWDEAIEENILIDRARELRRREQELAAKEAAIAEAAEKERIKKERQEAEERMKAEAAAQAKREAEEAARIKMEAAEREKRAAIEAAERAERARIQAEKDAEAKRIAAVEEAKRAAQEEADRKEQERLDAQRIAAERRVREVANLDHRRKINRAALQCFIEGGFSEEDAKKILVLIANGQIEHVTINY